MWKWNRTIRQAFSSRHSRDPVSLISFSTSFLYVFFFVLRLGALFSICCVCVWNNINYLHRICEPGIQPCSSVLDTGAFGGVFCDSFCQRVQCTTCFCVCKTQAASQRLSHPCTEKMKAHLSCYHSTMTEHKVIPVHECYRSPCVMCAKKNYFILHFSPSIFLLWWIVWLQGSVSASCHVGVMQLGLYSLQSLFFCRRGLPIKYLVCASRSLRLMSWHQSEIGDVFSKADVSVTDFFI